MVQACRLRIRCRVDVRGDRIQTVDRLMTTLTTDVLVTTGVTHQRGLARVVERREGVDVAALLHIGRRMAVCTVGLTRGQPMVAAIGCGGDIRRCEGYLRRHMAGIQGGIRAGLAVLCGTADVPRLFLDKISINYTI